MCHSRKITGAKKYIKIKFTLADFHFPFGFRVLVLCLLAHLTEPLLILIAPMIFLLWWTGEKKKAYLETAKIIRKCLCVFKCSQWLMMAISERLLFSG